MQRHRLLPDLRRSRQAPSEVWTRGASWPQAKRKSRIATSGTPSSRAKLLMLPAGSSPAAAFTSGARKREAERVEDAGDPRCPGHAAGAAEVGVVGVENEGHRGLHQPCTPAPVTVWPPFSPIGNFAR